MCGIVGLFCKSPELEPRLGEYLVGDARADGRARAGQRRRRRLPRPGACTAGASSRSTRPTPRSTGRLSRGARRLGGVEPPARATTRSSLVDGDADEAEAWIARAPSRSARDERRAA